MEFEYYLIVAKKPNPRGKILAVKQEPDGTNKMIPLFEGYQKATLYQSLRTADTIRKRIAIYGYTKDDLYVQPVTIEYGFDLPEKYVEE